MTTIVPKCTCSDKDDYPFAPCPVHGREFRRRFYEQTDLAEIGGLRIKPQEPLPEPKRIPGLYDILVVFMRHLTPDQLKTLQDAVMSIPKPDARK